MDGALLAAGGATGDLGPYGEATPLDGRQLAWGEVGLVLEAHRTPVQTGYVLVAGP